MAKIDYEKCIDLANKRLRDVITAANKADPYEMEALMMSSMCGNLAEFTESAHCSEEQTELTLNGDQTEGIYFKFQGYDFHITKDAEFNTSIYSDLYHIWCECEYFDGKEAPMSQTYIIWFCGGDFLEEKHKAFLNGEISEKEFADYIYNDISFYLRPWLKDNKEKINKA